MTMDSLSGLLIVLEVLLVLCMLALWFAVRLRRKNKLRQQAQEFSEIFNNAEKSLHSIQAMLKNSGLDEHSRRHISQRIYEQEKILASSIQFAYLNKGREPLFTVKEKLHRFVLTCVQSLAVARLPESEEQTHDGLDTVSRR